MVQFDTDVIGEREQVMVERGEVGGHIVSGKAMVKYESENLKKRTRGHTVMRGGILETLVHGEWGGGRAGGRTDGVDEEGGHGSVDGGWACGLTDGVAEEGGQESVDGGRAGGLTDGVTEEGGHGSVDGADGMAEEGGVGAVDGED